MGRSIIQEEKLFLPMQKVPFPVNPGLQTHVEFTHVA